MGKKNRSNHHRRHYLPLECLENRILLASDLVLSELQTINNSTLADEDGDFSDWIELHNFSAAPVDLNGWHLTDDVTDLTKWQFPPVTIAAGDEILVFASDKDRPDPFGELHTNFKLSSGGEYVGLVEPDGVTVAFEYFPQYPPQLADISYGLSANGSTKGYFTSPTPDAPNGNEPIDDPTRRIVISEIMHHPANENSSEEFIEIYNAGQVSVDLSGWSFSDGIQFVFPTITLPADNHLVIAADISTFQAKYPTITNVVGNWFGQLSNRSERLALVDAEGQKIDSVVYADQGDWAERAEGPLDQGHAGWVWTAQHDGDGKSLELIHVDSSNLHGQNWAASVAVNGTPGMVNSVATDETAPLILNVIHGPAIPRSTDPVTITAQIVDDILTDVSVSLFWRVDGASTFSTLEMHDKGQNGDGRAGDSVYAATIPPQPDGTVVEFYVQTRDTQKNLRTWPAPVQQTTTVEEISEAFPIVKEGAAARAHVPQDDSLGMTWTEELFDDSTWTEGTTGVGYDTSPLGAHLPLPISYWTFDKLTDGGSTAPDELGHYDGIVSGATLTTGGQGRFGEAISLDGDNDYVSPGIVPELTSPSAFSVSLWFRRTVDHLGDDVATMHSVNNVLIAQSSDGANDNLEIGTETDWIEVYLDSVELSGPTSALRESVSIPDSTWHHLVLTYDSSEAMELKLYWNGEQINEFATWGGPLSSSETSPLTIGLARPGGSARGDFEGLIDDVAIWDTALDATHVAALFGGTSPLLISGYTEMIGLDVQGDSLNQNASTYVRIPFQVDNPSSPDVLTLGMRYDDAFVAYLNGTEVARNGITGTTTWNSAADSERPDGAAFHSEKFLISNRPQLLKQDLNVLAIHALNVSSDVARRLALPELMVPQFQKANALFQVLDTLAAKGNPEPGSPPFYHQIMTAKDREEFTHINRLSDAQMNATFISVTGTGVDIRYNTGVRIRGGNSRFNDPPNNRINFPSDRPWQGVTAIQVNGVAVANQIAGSALFRLAGLPAAAAKPIFMYSNGQDLMGGVPYAHLEVFNSDFAENHFPSDNGGNLYRGRRPDESPPGGLGAGLEYFGLDPAPYVSYQKLTNESQSDWSDVISLTFQLNNSPHATYIQDVRQIVDIDQWLRFLALHTLLDNSEGGLVNGDPLGDDYVMYRGNLDPRFRMIAHDLDTLFVSTDDSIFQFTTVPALDRLVNHPEFLSDYYTQLLDLINNFLLTGTINTTLDEALRHVSTPAQVDRIKNFLVDRSLYVSSLIPQQLTISSPLPTLGDFHQTTSPSIHLTGTTHVTKTRSILVNGFPVSSLSSDGTWAYRNDVSGSESLVLISKGSTWKYLDDGSDQGTNWREVGFADSTWESGPAVLGYGDDNESTVVRFIDTTPEDPATITKNATTYFRSTFEVTNPTALASLQIHLRYDDAAAVYFNGVEAMRTEHLSSAASFDTYSVTDTPNEGSFYAFDVSPAAHAALVNGKNTIAVEVHQGDPTSSDIKFDLELRGTTETTGTGLILNPGVNRVVVQVLDEKFPEDILAAEFERGFIDIWYDDGSTQQVAGTLVGENVVWSAANGPFHVTDDVIVPEGTTLIVEPGTSLYFEQDTELIVQGVLQAAGTEYHRIRFTSVPNMPLVPDLPGLPDGPPRWDGIHFEDTTSPRNIISFADIDYAQDSGGSVGIVRSHVVLDNLTWQGSHLRLIYAEDASTTICNSVFPDMFAAGESPLALGLDNTAEHIKVVGVPPPESNFVIQNNFFGTNKGHNDVIDADSGRRPDPILQILDNVFRGSGDELLDLGGDVYVAGNLFMNVIKDRETTDRGYASAISTGDAGRNTTVVVVRNIFADVDHALNLKSGTAAIFENNTVVGIHDDFVDQFGRQNIGSALNFFVDEPGAIAGMGAYMSGNIFWDAPRIVGNVDVPADTTTHLQFDENLIDPVLATTVVGNRPGSVLDLGLRNLTGTPRFVDKILNDFKLLPDSVGQGTGPVGQDFGALVPKGIFVAGEPPATTSQTTATLTVGGPGIFAYRWRINGGPWSSEITIGNGLNPIDGTVRTEEILLSNLTAGDYIVEVLGQDFAGVWQTQPTTSKTWTVDPSTTTRLIINEILAKNETNNLDGTFPDMIELYNAGNTPIDLGGMSLSDDLSDPTQFIFAESQILDPNSFLVLFADDQMALPGQHLGFSLRDSGEGVYLFDTPDHDSQLIDSIVFGIQIPDFSIGRVGRDEHWALNSPTMGQPNIQQPLGDHHTLRINEWLTSSFQLVIDDALELYNPEPVPVDLSGMYLTDKPLGAHDLHSIPPLSFIAADGYLSLIADGQASTGADHLGFRLSADQEIIGLFDPSLELIDQILYFSQMTDVSQGRNPNGDIQFTYFSRPSLGRANLSERSFQVSLLDFGDLWSYEQSGDNLGTAWRDPAFDDSAWAHGAGPLGFERELLPIPLSTQLLELTSGPKTYYFRTHFTLDTDPLESVIQMTTLIDDAAVFYLNGNEILRLGMPSDEPNFQTISNRFVDEAVLEGPFLLDTSAFVRGDNVLAVELHQSTTGADNVFGLTLDATVTMQPNAIPDVAIHEIHYHPTSFPPGLTSTEREFEFIELRNTTNKELDLTNWKISGGIDFLLPAGTTIASNGLVVVTPFDPTQEKVKANAFRQIFNLPATSILTGGYLGGLGNGGDLIELKKPFDAIQISLGYEFVDRIVYNDNQPWAEAADGSGASLTRISLEAFTEFASNWTANTPSPGRIQLLGDLDRNGLVNATDIDLLFAGIHLGVADTLYDLDSNGTVELADVDYLLAVSLQTDRGDSDLDRDFDITDLIHLITRYNPFETEEQQRWADGNFDGDTDIDIDDFKYLSNHFNPPRNFSDLSSQMISELVAAKTVALPSSVARNNQNRQKTLSPFHSPQRAERSAASDPVIDSNSTTPQVVEPVPVDTLIRSEHTTIVSKLLGTELDVVRKVFGKFNDGRQPWFNDDQNALWWS